MLVGVDLKQPVGCGGGGGIARLSRCIRESLGPSGPPCTAWRPARAVLAGRTQWGPHPPRLHQTKMAPSGCHSLFGGGGGNRTPVRKSSTDSSTYLVRLIGF
jgi:hypothetical protein